MRGSLAPKEGKLGRNAACALGSSLVAVAIVVLSVSGLATGTWQSLVYLLLTIAYFALLYFLSTIDRHPARRRLNTWLCSIAAHLVIGAVAYMLVNNWFVFVFLLPEGISLCLNIAGTYLAFQTLQNA